MAQAPAWLFSFVDLAFLLLIAMTQISGDGQGVTPVFGTLPLPRVEAGAEGELPAGASERWQLRVHPIELASADPFELVAPGAAAELLRPVRLGADALRQRLGSLHKDRAEKPLLSPHADSRSEDLLEAVAQLEARWPGRRHATVLPRWDRP